ncbi:cell surface protein [Prevotella sp. HMSC077E09]|uniref:leucine-rich repeat domain-containing protein n=1 Tax=Prevotella sp. HMSC077E09 TaxID=1739487 RepID=UPI0008A54F3A|nr:MULTISPECIES: leucine-rich repeat domain-containing protein [unclassified Prevotella]OFO73857.1 cell surface protein [Prevotella sp. HMSC077E08]OFP53309.1 cell surface protein [Prevotella sp. HMSC077E09]
MAKIKLLLLALLFIAIPKGLYAYTNGQIVNINHMNYKVTSVALHQLAFLNADNTVVGQLVIPGKVSDNKGTIFTVTRVSFIGRYTCENITSVKLPETVTHLDVGVFSGASLESITIPKSVLHIEENANTQLKKVPKYIVDSDNPNFKSDSNGALYSKDGKTLRFVPSSIPLENGAYTVNSSVEKITKSCFTLINGLKKINLPPNLKEVSVGYPSIAPIKSLEEFAMPTVGATTPYSIKDGVLCKGNELVFYPRAKPVVDYKVPDGITSLANFSIAYPRDMEKIDLNQVTTMAKSSLLAAYKLTEVTLPKHLKKYNPTTKTGMEPGCIGSCSKLAKYIVPAENTDFEAVDGVVYSKLKKDVLYLYPAGKSGDTYNILPETKVIEALAFWSVQHLKTMTFPAGLDSIKDEAFRQLPKLEKVIFTEPSNIKHLGKAVFRACSKLTEVTLPSKITSLDMPFADCANLETINVPNGSQLKTLHSNSFSSNKKLKQFNFKGTCQLEEIESDAFAYLKNLESFTFPKTVKTIKTNAFRGCSGMKTAEFPSDAEIEKIGPGAFADCGLTSFKVPNNVKEIEREAFNKCSALTVVNLSEKTVKVSPEAFSLCSNLHTITFLCDNKIDPAKINQLQNKRSFDDGKEAPNLMEKIDIHVRKEKISDYQNDNFYKKFKSINPSFVNGTEEYIAVSDGAVDMLKTTREDETFVFPEKVTHNGKDYVVSLIGDYAFNGVSNKVKEVVVTKDVKYVGAKAFMTDKEHKTSTIQSVFFIESNPTKEMLSTTRFDLDDTGNNYNEFATTTDIYVKKTALPTYQTEWGKTVYKKETDKEEKSPLDFTSQLKYQIPGVTIKNKYSTFAREFDVDFGVYNTEKGNSKVAAFVAKISDVKPGSGDYGNSNYFVKMSSVDVNGGYSSSYDYVPANTGVLLKVLDKEATSNDFYYAIGEKDDQVYSVNNNIMTGVIVNSKSVLASAADPVYLIQGGIFRKAVSTINPFPIHKAYAKIAGVPAGAKLTLVFAGDDNTTGITTVDATKTGDDSYYNLNGQRVINPQHGVFIRRGRKVIIK